MEILRGKLISNSNGKRKAEPRSVLSMNASSAPLTIDQHHDHRHLDHKEAPVFGGHDLNMVGVLLHVLGDAANNLGVMAAALVIWLTRYEARYYADPATSLGIAAMICLSALPLIRESGLVLLESAPKGLDPVNVKHDLEKIPGVLAIHELHIWRLSQHKVLASVHVAMLDQSVSEFSELSRTIKECFHAWGVHSVSIMPETALTQMSENYIDECQSKCSSFCKELACCG
ncbi:putative di-, tri-valent inorganic cation transporter [Aspergillus mulundensis]|uniref:Uncharacterized protein n=1 Tax=Aspergillus mulundensis TaxID=1810919 RepID=A0A3D8QZC4_9EURO|nr:hypothetical protein DSM5745_09022 [Aspergillus mulundensis]RDW67156.1 hypothetical protein DSM5745_09022 [Aspergillus mulundensis]